MRCLPCFWAQFWPSFKRSATHNGAYGVRLVISPRGWGGGLVAGHGLQEIAHTWSGWDEIHTSYDDAADMVADMVAGCCWMLQSRHQNVKAELSDVFHPSFRFSQKVPKA